MKVTAKMQVTESSWEDVTRSYVVTTKAAVRCRRTVVQATSAREAAAQVRGTVVEVERVEDETVAQAAAVIFAQMHAEISPLLEFGQAVAGWEDAHSVVDANIYIHVYAQENEHGVSSKAENERQAAYADAIGEMVEEMLQAVPIRSR